MHTSHVLDTCHGKYLQRVVVQKGHANLLAYVNEFLVEAKISGLLQVDIGRTGLRGIKDVLMENFN